jgi:hypothetical protein
VVSQLVLFVLFSSLLCCVAYIYTFLPPCLRLFHARVFAVGCCAFFFPLWLSAPLLRHFALLHSSLLFSCCFCCSATTSLPFFSAALVSLLNEDQQPKPSWPLLLLLLLFFSFPPLCAHFFFCLFFTTICDLLYAPAFPVAFPLFCALLRADFSLVVLPLYYYCWCSSLTTVPVRFAISTTQQRNDTPSKVRGKSNSASGLACRICSSSHHLRK